MKGTVSFFIVYLQMLLIIFIHGIRITFECVSVDFIDKILAIVRMNFFMHS